MIVETNHVNFDELPQMASDHVSSDPDPQCSTTVLEQDSLSPSPQSQENVHHVEETVTTSNELELLYSPMFCELLNGTSPIVSKSSAVHAADNPDKRQQHNITHTSTTTDVEDPPPLNIQSTHQTPTQVPTNKEHPKEAMADSALIESILEKRGYGFETNMLFRFGSMGSVFDSRKSTSGGIQFLGGDKLVSWSSKKQDYTSMSLAEAEYVSLSACYAQVLWLRTAHRLWLPL
ncbi:hypothetical protein Tco_0366133 [Tanacetum coccineum]